MKNYRPSHLNVSTHVNIVDAVLSGMGTAVSILLCYHVLDVLHGKLRR